MRTFLIVMKIILSIFGIIWNCFVKLIIMIISAWNKYVRARNDRINRGVTEIKSSTYDSLLPDNRSVENAMVSGGSAQVRAGFISRYASNANNQGYPVIILHENNTSLPYELTSAISKQNLVIIDQRNPAFEPFYKLSAREINRLMFETATKDYDLKKNASYYIDGMCDFLKYKKVPPTLKAFNSCPHVDLFDKIDLLVVQGIITDTQGQGIKSKIMMGQSEQFKLSSLFEDLYDQSERILCKTKGASKYNVVQAVSDRKVLVIDISSNVNNLLVNVLLSQIRQVVSKGSNMVLIMDELTSSGNELVKKILCERTDKCKLISCSSDAYSMCDGDEKTFSTVVGNCEDIIILGHSSGATCTKWAETIGYYNKEEESSSVAKGSMRHSPFSLFPGSNNTVTKNYNIKREYIVRPELINRMGSNEVYAYRHSDNKLIHTYL